MAMCGSPVVRVKRRERSSRGQVVANVEPPPPPAAYHEEDESGGFESYRGNPRRLRAPDDRRHSDTRPVCVALEDPPPHRSADGGGVYHISVDPLEADIRSLLALEARRAARAAKSLPNLRASRESLLPHDTNKPSTPAPATVPTPSAPPPS